MGEKLEINVRTMRHRNDAGCPVCNHRGVKSQTLVAEMIFPSERLLHLLREKDFAEAEREWHSAADGRWDTPNMTGKPVYAHALYKALVGQVDPSVIDRFMNIDFINPNLIRKRKHV
jgi:type II secretory ATPase GspE/PulE/Tfp pilus assembly ATPase PilB-like protein